MNAMLTMSSFIFPLITFPYVSRILSPDGIGKVTTATSFISYFTMVAQLGIPTYGIRVCARNKDDKEKLTKTVHELMVINLVMSLFMYIILAALLLTVPKLQGDRTLYIIVSANILLTSIGMEWLYKALEKYAYITIRSLIFKVIALAAMFFLVRSKNDYIIYGGISIFAACASNIFNFINAHKYIGFKPLENYHFKQHIKSVGIFFAMSCATTIYLHLDVIMLAFMKTEVDVGYYTAATKIKNVLVGIVTSLGTVLLPRVSYFIKNNMLEEFRSVTTKALNFVFLISVPLVVYFMIFAKSGIYFLSGKEFDGAIQPMVIIMPTLLLIGITNVLGIQILVPRNQEIYVLYSEIAGAATDLILNAILIPVMASSGAALGTVMAELVVLLVQFWVLRREITPMFQTIKYHIIIFAVLCAACLSLMVFLLPLTSNFMILLISSVVFFGIYLALLVLMKEQFVLDSLNQISVKLLKKKLF